MNLRIFQVIQKIFSELDARIPELEQHLIKIEEEVHDRIEDLNKLQIIALVPSIAQNISATLRAFIGHRMPQHIDIADFNLFIVSLL